MKRALECEFEADVLDAVIQSRWPDRVAPELRAHVAGCPICSDVAAVAAAIDRSREQLRDEPARIPDSGRVWWVAQMRARREAAQAAGRPITVAQVLAFACAVGLLGACFGATSTWFQALLAWFGEQDFGPLLAAHALLAAAMLALVLVIPAAVYLVVGRD
jgi:hypothetical protein